MSEITLTVKYTKPGDIRTNARTKVWTLKLPVSATSPTEDLLLQLPPKNAYGAEITSYYYTVPAPIEEVMDEDLPSIVQALQQKHAKEVADVKAQEEKQAQIKAKNERAFLARIQEDVSFILQNDIPLPNHPTGDLLLVARRFEATGEVGYEVNSNLKRDPQAYGLTEEQIESLKNKLDLDFAQKNERNCRVHRERHEQEEKEKKEQQEKKDAFVKAWAEKHGSDRLQAQLQMGYPGLTLFYQEKLAHDFPGMDVKLDKRASEYDLVTNPTLDQLHAEISVAEQLVVLNLAKDFDEAKNITKVAFVDVDDDDSDRVYFVVVEGYKFGEVFDKSYTIAFQL